MDTRIRLVQTCGACPEAYDAYIDDQYVGYLRLRYGSFRAEYRGETVFHGNPRGDGIFEWEERDLWLNRGCRALLDAHEANDAGELLFDIGEAP